MKKNLKQLNFAKYNLLPEDLIYSSDPEGLSDQAIKESFQRSNRKSTIAKLLNFVMKKSERIPESSWFTL